MKTDKPIDVETLTEEKQAVVVHQRQEVALTASQISERLRFIKQVMSDNMTEGTDYGKVPGCGDKPGLFQPGAQKLSMTFQLNPEVREETINEYQNYHRGYRLVVRVSNGNKFADGVGECSTLESKYRYRQGSLQCPECKKHSIIKGQEQYGGGWVCYKKKGGCGAKWKDGTPVANTFATTNVEKAENDNPADCWNTVRKMAFKRAFVHAIINATNTSELWSQDLEDLHANGQAPKPDDKEEHWHHRPDDADEGSDLGPQARAAATQGRAASPDSAKDVSKGQAQAAATTRHRDRMIARLIEMFGAESQAQLKEFFVKAGTILQTEGILDVPLRFCPVSLEQMDALEKAVAGFFDGDEAKIPYPANPEDTREVAPTKGKPVEVPRDKGVGDWKFFPVPFGKNKGTTLGKLAPDSLRWYVNQFKVTTEYEGKPKKPETIAKDQLFRSMLDAAKAELGIKEEA